MGMGYWKRTKRIGDKGKDLLQILALSLRLLHLSDRKLKGLRPLRLHVVPVSVLRQAQ